MQGRAGQRLVGSAATLYGCDGMSHDPHRSASVWHVYMERGEPQQDSARMRRRLAELVRSSHDLRDVANAFKGELGIDIPYPSNWPVFFRDCDLQDVSIASRSLIATSCARRALIAMWTAMRQRTGAPIYSASSKKNTTARMSKAGSFPVRRGVRA